MFISNFRSKFRILNVILHVCIRICLFCCCFLPLFWYFSVHKNTSFNRGTSRPFSHTTRVFWSLNLQSNSCVASDDAKQLSYSHNVKYLAQGLKYNNVTSHTPTPDVRWTYLVHICVPQRTLLSCYSSHLQSHVPLPSFRFRALVFWIASNFITGVPARDDHLKCLAVLTTPTLLAY